MLKIMIVDDDFIVRQGMCDMIRWSELGCLVVDQADDGEDALTKMETNLPDVVFTDVVMPRMSGTVLLSRVRERWPWVKVVMVSAHDESEYIRQALKNEAVDYLIKPFGEQDIAQVILNIRRKMRKELITLSDNCPADPQQLLDVAAHAKHAITALSEYDREQALLHARALFYAIRSNEVKSMLLATSICVDLMLCAIQIMKNRIANADVGEFTERMNQICNARTMDEMEQTVIGAVGEIADRLAHSGGVAARLVQSAVRAIEAGYAGNITIAQLADGLHVSENYLQTLFKREQGQTIRQYITAVRIDKAKELLKNTDEKVYRISESVGYLDTDYFSRTFHKVTGMTPNQYREKCS